MEFKDIQEMLEKNNLSVGCEICGLFDEVYEHCNRFCGWEKVEVDSLKGRMLRDTLDEINIIMRKGRAIILLHTEKYGLRINFVDFERFFSVTTESDS